MKPLPVLKALPMWLVDSALFTLPPMLADAALPWPSSVNVGSVTAFLAVYAAFMLAWWVLLSATGYPRWRLYRVWRPGMRPCMCDKPTYCLRHRSSAKEPNRPGVVAARLREDA